MSKTGVIIYERKEFSNSLRRALKAIGDIDTTNKFPGTIAIAGNKDEVLMIESLSSLEGKYPLLCRIRNSYCNPIIMFGYETNETFYANPKSRAFFRCAKAHKFISVPFDLESVMIAITDLDCLSEQERKDVYTKYFHWHGLITSIVDHDLNNSLKVYKSITQTLEIYENIKCLIPLQCTKAIKAVDKMIKIVRQLPTVSGKLDSIDETSRAFKKYVLGSDYYKSFLKHLPGEM